MNTQSDLPTETTQQKKNKLSPLREDLKLFPAPRLDDGSPSWTIFDPVRQSYFRIGWLELELLNRWHEQDMDTIISRVNQETTLTAGQISVENMQQFLRFNNLIQEDNFRQLYNQYKGLKSKNLISHLFKTYLFLRIPLFKPDNFLTATAPLISFFFNHFFWIITAFIGTFAGYLSMRQWDSFQQTFLYFFSMEGAIYYAVALTVVKTMHEFGHAYAAKRYGLHVPTMGVAFILFWPVLYTDTTDAWRLTSRKNRITIGAAGVLVELLIAVIATFSWSFLPDGPLRSSLFLLATTTWLVTLSINLNPFMRFDGYYLLADYLDVANLQTRAFALGKWYLRKIFFGYKQFCPENISRRKRNILIFYAYATWVYRFFLFLGIALLLYQFTFKLLGIFLMAVEIYMFIAMPVYRETQVWWKARKDIGFTPNILVTFAFLGALLYALFHPWPTIIEIPSVYRSAIHADIYTPQYGQIIQSHITDGDLVKKGTPLFKIYSPELNFKIKECQSEIEALQIRLKQINFIDKGVDRIGVLQKQLTKKMTALDGYKEQQQRLTIRAPIAGTVQISNNELPLYSWVNPEEPLLTLIDEHNVEIEGMVNEDDYSLIKEETHGRFYPEATEIQDFDVSIVEIDSMDLNSLKKPYLASTYGGDIPVRENAEGLLVPHKGYYKIIMKPQSSANQGIKYVLRGSVRIKAEPQNLLQRIKPRIEAVLIRESSF